ncbi:polymeric immunoglobulin receptor-like isoform X2 [Salminus brasiliensis]|uniref:polymeric immunoglobulin receptor-like isoform X2 n=1 Tax=Salminus brasiliensis TaxID=930266 RepID=UPI003B8397C6
MGFYSLSSSLILLVFLLFISDSESVRTLKKLAVRRGGSLSVPCFYDKQHKLNHKYWCRGHFWISCGIVAYTDTSGGTSVTDHPTQNMFTVELNSLQDSDSGYYWCAVKIGGIGTPDDRDYVDLTVSADPAVRVENSRVSGQEGGSVSVQCFYGAEYKNKEKKWCRFKDSTCYSGGRTNTSQSSAVLVADYGTGSFRVEMSGLQKRDAGWYWCSAGDVGVTVHLNVTEKPTTTTAATTVTTSQRTSIHQSISGSTNGTETQNKVGDGGAMLFWVLLAVGLVLLLLLLLVSPLTCMLRKTSKENVSEARERSSDTAVHTTSSLPAPENDVTYSSVRKAPKNKTRSSPPAPEDDVTYSSVRKAPKNKTLQKTM